MTFRLFGCPSLWANACRINSNHHRHDKRQKAVANCESLWSKSTKLLWIFCFPFNYLFRHFSPLSLLFGVWSDIIFGTVAHTRRRRKGGREESIGSRKYIPCSLNAASLLCSRPDSFTFFFLRGAPRMPPSCSRNVASKKNYKIHKRCFEGKPVDAPEEKKKISAAMWSKF